jgi:hypothetical protein
MDFGRCIVTRGDEVEQVTKDQSRGQLPAVVGKSLWCGRSYRVSSVLSPARLVVDRLSMACRKVFAGDSQWKMCGHNLFPEKVL